MRCEPWCASRGRTLRRRSTSPFTSSWTSTTRSTAGRLHVSVGRCPPARAAFTREPGRVGAPSAAARVGRLRAHRAENPSQTTLTTPRSAARSSVERDVTSGPGGLGDRWLEAVRSAAAQFGLAPAELKPCIAAILDGNLSGADRHEAAFVLAMEFRRIGLDGSQTLPLLQRWSRGIGYPMREAARAVESAFRRNPDGSFKYHAPGLNKRPGTVYARVLAPFCLDVDCPRNCPPFMRRGRADFRDEGFSRFVQLGWHQHLRSLRFLAAGRRTARFAGASSRSSGRPASRSTSPTSSSPTFPAATAGLWRATWPCSAKSG